MLRIALFLSLFFVTSCASDDAVEADAYASAQMKQEYVESISGKVDVYTSMARAAKYNTADLASGMRTRVFDQNPREVVKNITNIEVGHEGKMYNSLRILDFAIAHAVAHLSDDVAYIDSYLFAKSAENLSKAAIKAHQDALFGLKKEKEIGRIVRDATKEVKVLDEQYNKRGRLSEDEQYYRKGLEVGVLKFNDLTKVLDRQIDVYTKLAKTPSPKDLNLEGRSFYELENLDKRFTIETFQKAAIHNRSEMRIAQEFGKRYDFDSIRIRELKRYPEVERLNINNYNVEDPIYMEKLMERALRIANNLIEVTNNYTAFKARIVSKAIIDNPEERNRLRQRAIEEMGIAILVQIDLAYNIVELARVDEEALQFEIKGTTKAIKQYENKAGYTRKVEVLENKVKLANLEAKKSQILGEKALAIRSLYFYAGFEPFTKTLLNKDVSDIAKALKVGFNEDVIEILARTPAPEAKPEQKLDNEWAKEDGWLENLLEKPAPKAEKPVAAAQPLVTKSVASADAYASVEHDKRTVMQIGSYLERKNADVEWNKLKANFPELQGYTPKIEPVVVNGKNFYRMSVESSSGGLKDLCNKMRENNAHCILR